MWSIVPLRRILDSHDVVQRAYLERYYGMNTSAANVYGRFEPATPAELATGRQFWSRGYPPSYRTFLRVNNGWRRFGLGWSLLGAPSPRNRDMFRDVKNTLRQLSNVAGPEEQEDLAQRQTKDPKVILSSEHTVLGTDFNGGLLLFDNNRVSKSKEPQVVSVQSVVDVVDRWGDFEAFVRDVTSRVRQRLERVQASDNASTPKARPAGRKPSGAAARRRQR